LHFEVPSPIENESLVYKLNRVLHKDIHVLELGECSSDFHARFSAVSRRYKYLIDLEYPLYLQDQVFHYSYGHQTLDIDKIKQAAELLLAYEEFFPFCKSKSQVAHFKCQLIESQWELVDKRYLIYSVQANRFLRGMVRLIVGMCLEVGKGQMEIKEVQHALDAQIRLRKPYSAPACGLYLFDVKYPTGSISTSANGALFFPI
jgi:tRNA pseudouridine38-40 synthase